MIQGWCVWVAENKREYVRKISFLIESVFNIKGKYFVMILKGFKKYQIKFRMLIISYILLFNKSFFYHEKYLNFIFYSIPFCVSSSHIIMCIISQKKPHMDSQIEIYIFTQFSLPPCLKDWDLCSHMVTSSKASLTEFSSHLIDFECVCVY